MKKNLTTSTGREGAAIFTVMAVIFTVSALLGTMVTISMQRAHVTQRLADRIRAVANAEAGASEAFSILQWDFDQKTNAALFTEKSYGEGTYHAAVTPVSSNMAVICCTGICGEVEVVVILDIKDYGFDQDWTEDNDPFNFSVLSGGSLSWEGAGDFMMMSNAPLHCNDLFKLQGGGSVSGEVSSTVGIKFVGGPSVIGDVTAPYVQGVPPGTITGDQNIEAVPPVTIPDVDLTPYYNAASDNGTVMDAGGGTLIISSIAVLENISANGGILWVNGDVKITANGSTDIAIFATGDVTITSDFNQEKVEDYPAVVSRDGDIDLAGNGTYHGLIYAKSGDIEKTGAGLVTGTLVCAGDFYKGGGWSAMSYEDSVPVPPTGYENPYDDIGVSAWQK